MFRKLFGETEQDQLQYLKNRSIVTIIIVALVLVALLLNVVGLKGGAGTIAGIAEIGFAIVMLFVWGWPIIKKLFGITTIGVILSGNVIVGLLLFLFYILLAYFLGIVFAFIGTIRYLFLLIKYGKKG